MLEEVWGRENVVVEVRESVLESGRDRGRCGEVLGKM